MALAHYEREMKSPSMSITLEDIRLHERIYVYTNIYMFTPTYTRLHEHIYVYT